MGGTSLPPPPPAGAQAVCTADRGLKHPLRMHMHSLNGLSRDTAPALALWATKHTAPVFSCAQCSGAQWTTRARTAQHLMHRDALGGAPCSSGEGRSEGRL